MGHTSVIAVDGIGAPQPTQHPEEALHVHFPQWIQQRKASAVDDPMGHDMLLPPYTG